MPLNLEQSQYAYDKICEYLLSDDPPTGQEYENLLKAADRHWNRIIELHQRKQRRLEVIAALTTLVILVVLALPYIASRWP